jgi:uncharacterized protein
MNAASADAPGPGVVARVAGLAIAPVKALGLAHPDSIRLDAAGVAGDRRFVLVTEDGRPVSTRQHPSLLQVTADCDTDATWLRLTFPDGTVTEGRVRPGPVLTVRTWRREVAGTLVDGPWDAALQRYLAAEVRLVRVAGPAVDDADVSLASTAAVQAFAAAAGEPEDVAAGRFRLNLLVAGPQAHGEDAWAGLRVRVGEAVLDVREPIPRCAVTCYHPRQGTRDRNALLVLKGTRGLSVRRTIDFGVYARVEVPGVVRLGDAVTVEVP